MSRTGLRILIRDKMNFDLEHNLVLQHVVNTTSTQNDFALIESLITKHWHPFFQQQHWRRRWWWRYLWFISCTKERRCRNGRRWWVELVHLKWLLNTKEDYFFQLTRSKKSAKSVARLIFLVWRKKEEKMTKNYGVCIFLRLS